MKSHEPSEDIFEAWDVLCASAYKRVTNGTGSITDTVLVEMHKYMSALHNEVPNLEYKIDQLMLEYCPNEMSIEQVKNWAEHQRVSR